MVEGGQPLKPLSFQIHKDARSPPALVSSHAGKNYLSFFLQAKEPSRRRDRSMVDRETHPGLTHITAAQWALGEGTHGRKT